MSSKYFIKCNFSDKHKGQWSVFVFPWSFSTIDHLLLYVIFACFDEHTIYFDNSVILLCCLWQQSSLWHSSHSIILWIYLQQVRNISLFHRWLHFQDLLYIQHLVFNICSIIFNISFLTSALQNRADSKNKVNNKTKIYLKLAAITFKGGFGNHKEDINTAGIPSCQYRVMVIKNAKNKIQY